MQIFSPFSICYWNKHKSHCFYFDFIDILDIKHQFIYPLIRFTKIGKFILAFSLFIDLHLS